MGVTAGTFVAVDGPKRSGNLGPRHRHADAHGSRTPGMPDQGAHRRLRPEPRESCSGLDLARGQGHAWLIEPDGRVIASPVWDEPECYRPFGDLTTRTAAELWEAYPYKTEHLAKYLERTLIVR